MNNTPLIHQLALIVNGSTSMESVFWGGLKWLYLLAFFLYLLFALIVVRQVDMMTRAFQTSAEGLLKIFSYLHFGFAVVVLVVAILVL